MGVRRPAGDLIGVVYLARGAYLISLKKGLLRDAERWFAALSFDTCLV
jgi:hypothetical protein